jgi:membrane glycosyltransferase
MDTLTPLAPQGGSGWQALPPETPLAMPQQSLWQRREPSRAPTTVPKGPSLRRAFVFGTSIAMTLVAAEEMYEVLRVGGLTYLETVVLVLFVALFAWIALSFVSSVAGFVLLLRGRGRPLGIDPDAPLPSLTRRTALLLPTYNEDPERVMARLQAIFESVCETGQGAQFDAFVLSDTTEPAIWVAEEAALLRLRAALGSDRVFYRHRTRNIGRKAGNIGEWVTRFGGAYDHMIVLDADSLLQGDTIVRLASAMERHANVALIQTLPQLVNGETLFARLQQFAARVYGPLIARGIAWWHGSEGNYWGHNAIIRVAAFADEAGLPLLKGCNPFGGHILSHDFVEAALMRRGGWAIHMAPELGGSYEECPPTLTDYAVRDRRWCQGNLQHLAVLPARGLHWVSRLHLLTGIGSYITAPLWLLFLLAGILISLQAEFIRPEYFPRGATLFPHWPAQDPVRAAYVFAGTMGLLILPKIMGFVAMLPRRKERRGVGGPVRGFVSLLTEIIISALIAPVMMLRQCRAVVEILLGRDSGWAAQRRDGGETATADIVRQYMWPSALGAMLGIGAYAVSAPLLAWMLPVVAGLLLAIPIALWTAQASVGRRLRAMGLLLTPEERSPPALLLRANELASQNASPELEHPLTLLVHEHDLCEAHLAMTAEPPPRRKGEVDVHLVVALAKIDQADDREEAIALLGLKEVYAVLSHRSALLKLIEKPGLGTVPRDAERLAPVRRRNSA